MLKGVNKMSFTVCYSLREKEKGLISLTKDSVKRGPFDILYCPLATKGQRNSCSSILKTVLKESKEYPLLSISHLGTKGRDGQAGINAVLKETIGHPLLSFSPLEIMGRD